MAATFYSITIVGITTESLWGKWTKDGKPNTEATNSILALMFVAFAVVLYNSFFVTNDMTSAPSPRHLPTL